MTNAELESQVRQLEQRNASTCEELRRSRDSEKALREQRDASEARVAALEGALRGLAGNWKSARSLPPMTAFSSGRNAGLLACHDEVLRVLAAAVPPEKSPDVELYEAQERFVDARRAAAVPQGEPPRVEWSNDRAGSFGPTPAPQRRLGHLDWTSEAPPAGEPTPAIGKAEKRLYERMVDEYNAGTYYLDILDALRPDFERYRQSFTQPAPASPDHTALGLPSTVQECHAEILRLRADRALGDAPTVSREVDEAAVRAPLQLAMYRSANEPHHVAAETLRTGVHEALTLLRRRTAERPAASGKERGE